jgi:tetratricopeptide (TPR) repeat protein
MLLEQERYEESLADCEKAVALMPDRSQGYYLRGMAHEGKKEYSEALADFSKAIELNRRYFSAYASRGLVLLHQGKDDEAQKDFTRARELNPGSKPELDRRIKKVILERGK